MCVFSIKTVIININVLYQYFHSIRLGEHTRSKEGGKKQSHSISLKAWYNDYDLALLKLQKPATINSHVGTICLPEATNSLPIGTVLWQTGWGRISHGGRFPDVLKELEVVIKEQVGILLWYLKTAMTVNKISF